MARVSRERAKAAEEPEVVALRLEDGDDRAAPTRSTASSGSRATEAAQQGERGSRGGATYSALGGRSDPNAKAAAAP